MNSVTIAAVKGKQIYDFYIAYSSYISINKNCFLSFYFCFRGGQISPLMHVSQS